MGLRWIVGRAGTGKTRRCLEEIKDELIREPAGKPLLFILPEQATYQMERELASTPGVGGFLRAHVVGFRRLSYRVLDAVGGGAKPQLSDLGKRLILERILWEKEKEFSLFVSAAHQRGFAGKMAALLKECKNHNVRPSQLQFASEVMGNSGGVISAKIRDVALVYEAFESFIQGKYIDPEDYLNLLLDRMTGSALLEGSRVWVDGFHFFTPQEYKVLECLIEQAKEVTITLSLSQPDSTRHLAESSLFFRQAGTYRSLNTWGREKDISIETEELVQNWRFGDNPLLEHLACQWESRVVNRWTENDGKGLVIAEGTNRRVEIEHIARDIIRLCRDEGYRYRDMAVLLRDLGLYQNALETIFTDYDIPFFIDDKRSAVHHPLAELVRSAIDVVSSGWTYDAVFRVLKTDLFPVSRDDTDRLENYVLQFGIRGSRRWREEVWIKKITGEMEVEAELGDVKNEIDELRRLVSKTLGGLEDHLKKGRSVQEMSAAVFQLLEELEIDCRLDEWASKAEAMGNLAEAREHRRMFAAVINLLDQLVDAMGDKEIPLAEYGAILGEGLDGLTLAMIPPGLDYVAVSSLERTKLDNMKVLYLPGLNEGVFPRRTQEEGIVNDSERKKLEEVGIYLSSGVVGEIYEENFLVYLALTRAREYIWMSCALADDEGKGLQPSPIMKRVEDICNRRGRVFLTEEPVAGQEMDCLVHPQKSLSRLAAALREYRREGVLSEIWQDVYNWAREKPEIQDVLRQSLAGLFHTGKEESLSAKVAEKLYCSQGILGGSVTRLESFRACPFLHFARYGLNLRERRIFRLGAPDFGQFLHSVVKYFGDQLQEKKREWGSLSETECRSLVEEAVMKLAPLLQNEILLSSAQMRHLLQRLETTAHRALWRLSEFDKVSAFSPKALEIPFGIKGEGFPPLRYALSNGQELMVRGVIDRVDWVEGEDGGHVLVLDYKTGGAWLRLEDVYYGTRIQLLTYLMAACRGLEKQLSGRWRPAGILYYFLKNPSIVKNYFMGQDEVKQELAVKGRMPGWVLQDEEVISWLDGEFTSRSNFLRLARKKDGSLDSRSGRYVKTESEFQLLFQHVENVIGQTGENIMSGQVEVQPYQLGGDSPCGICAYRPVCQFDQALPEHKMRMLPRLDDKTVLERLNSGKEDKA